MVEQIVLTGLFPCKRYTTKLFRRNVYKVLPIGVNYDSILFYLVIQGVIEINFKLTSELYVDWGQI